MKIVAEKHGLEQLRNIKERVRADVGIYEEHAVPCAECNTPGACCLDEHFVNVRISRLEATAVATVLEKLDPFRRAAVYERVSNSAETPSELFACPLYERGAGCLVHHEAKPVPCIMHACYERADDLPPNELQDQAEMAIDRLNLRVYGSPKALEPLPAAVHAAILRTRKMKAITSPDKNHPAT